MNVLANENNTRELQFVGSQRETNEGRSEEEQGEKAF